MLEGGRGAGGWRRCWKVEEVLQGGGDAGGDAGVLVLV